MLTFSKSQEGYEDDAEQNQLHFDCHLMFCLRESDLMQTLLLW